MIGPWHVVLRDVMVFLAALALFVTAAFMAMVGWQLWRLAKAIYGDSEPIVASVRRLIDGLSDTFGYVSSRVITPGADAVADVRGATAPMRQQLKRFYAGARSAGARSADVVSKGSARARRSGGRTG